MTSGKAPNRDDRDSSSWERWFSGFRLMNSKWVPAFTSLTVVLGGGSVVYSARYRRIYRDVLFDLVITPSGGATTQSGAGATRLAPPLQIINDGVCQAVNGSSKASIGNGFVDAATNQIWLPTWAATSNKIVISGRYET